MRQRTKNQLASGGTVGGVLEFICQASEACSGEEIQYQLLLFDTVSSLAVLSSHPFPITALSLSLSLSLRSLTIPGVQCSSSWGCLSSGQIWTPQIIHQYSTHLHHIIIITSYLQNNKIKKTTKTTTTKHKTKQTKPAIIRSLKLYSITHFRYFG